MIDSSMETAETELGFPIAEIFWLIAKAMNLGMSPKKVADVYSIPLADVVELQIDEQYMAIKSWLSQKEATRALDTDEKWDQAESVAIGNLLNHAQISKDPDFNLSLARIANGAQRRTRQQVISPLDMHGSGAEVNLKLTTRITQKLANDVFETKTIEMTQRGNLEDLQAPQTADLSAFLGTKVKAESEAVRIMSADRDTGMVMDSLMMGPVDNE